jgi:hypothetical protein
MIAVLFFILELRELLSGHALGTQDRSRLDRALQFLVRFS